MENVREELLYWISLTLLLTCTCLAVIVKIAWNLGADYKMVTENKARRLNCLEKFFNGLHKFMKI